MPLKWGFYGGGYFLLFPFRAGSLLGARLLWRAGSSFEASPPCLAPARHALGGSVMDYDSVVVWRADDGLQCQRFSLFTLAEDFARTVGGVVFCAIGDEWDVRSDVWGSGEYVPVCGGSL